MENKKTFLFFALVAVLCLAFFPACSSDSDDDDDTNAIATFVGTYEADEEGLGTVTETIYFYEDGQFQIEASIPGHTQPTYRGTYTGDPNADGEITITETAYYEDGSWVEDKPYSSTITITNGSFTYDETTFTRK